MSKTPEEIVKSYKCLPEEKRVQVDKLLDESSKEQPQGDRKIVMEEIGILLPEQDRAERYSLARVIADQLAKSENIRTYSINGPWGCGKTVFMNWIKEELEKRQDEKIVVVPFNAWKYENVGNIVYPLMQELKNRAKGKKFDEEIEKCSKKVLSLIVMVFGVGIIAQSLGWKEAINIAYILFKSIKYKSKELQARKEEINNLQIAFEEWVEYIVKSYEIPKCTKIVFLIDELDRCTPGSILTLLESIKIFFGIKNTIFVLAIDKRIIANAINIKYNSLSNEDGYEYLEKMIEFSYELPFKPEIIWNNVFNDLRKEFTELNNIDLTFIPSLLTISNTKSMRKIKRILNRFVFILQEFKRYGNKVDEQILFFTIFLQDVYPEVYELIKSNITKNIFSMIDGINFDTRRKKDTTFGLARKILDIDEKYNIQEVEIEFRKKAKINQQIITIGENIKNCIIQMERIGI